MKFLFYIFSISLSYMMPECNQEQMMKATSILTIECQDDIN